jgi:rod shape determining protein RodA
LHQSTGGCQSILPPAAANCRPATIILASAAWRAQITGINRKIDSSRVLEGTRRMVAGSDRGRTDWVAPVCMVLLALIGVLFIYSAQYPAGSGFWVRQLIWIAAGAVLYTVVANIDYKIYLENALWFYLGAIILLLLIWTPLGVEREGARRWLNLRVLAYQPSEAAKVSTLIMLASVLARSEWAGLQQAAWLLAKIFLLTGLPMVLIFLQPDLGSCLVIPPMLLSLLYLSRLSERFFTGVFVLTLIGGGVLGFDLWRYSAFLGEHQMSAMEARGKYQETSWMPLRDYQRERIMTFVAPEVVDPRGTGSAWNAVQAQQAVGTGGLLGKGWLNGLQARLGYLPRSVAHNDFIFAVIAEETGFIGATTVLGIFALLLFNGIRIAGCARDRFGLLLAAGVTVIFLIHVFINMGMTIGMTPITGLPLPFVSYGGSFMLSCCFLQGMIQSVHRYRRRFD